jgi:hypothetical protein
MNPWITAAGLTAATIGAIGLRRAWRTVRERGLDRWVPSYLASNRRPVDLSEDAGPLDVFIAVCDHFEPEWGRPDRRTALARVDEWCRRYPELFGRFTDTDGRPPQHTFFFPQDEYQPEYLDRLADLVHAGYGDVDVHLHHDHDTPQGLRDKLESFRDELSHRHGLLRTDPVTGRVVYGFIHGNWALCNARPDGRWCGVDHELPILLDTGCYADFTMPSAPSDTQTTTINSIYYACDQPQGRKSHDRGERARVGRQPPEHTLLMIQGPLTFDFGRRKWGLLPRIENGDLLASHPPDIRRLEAWLQAGVTVAGQPRWRFVKLHTHGCKPVNQAMWLSETVQRFHADLANRHRQKPNFRYHYVTAWELAQLVHAAEQGRSWTDVLRPAEISASTGQASPI